LLEKAEDWASKAIKLNDNYDNNILLAEILFKLNRNTFARITAEKANKKAHLEKRDPIKAMILLSNINKDHSDITPPVIQISSPVTLNRGVIIVEAARKITVIGTVYDNSGVEKVLINGNMARLSADGNFDGETVLTSSSNLITVEAFDKRGNRALKQFKVEKKADPVFTSNRNNSSSLLGRQRALLFATDRYDTWTNLFNPIQDAEAIARDMQEYYGFEVDLQRNLSKEEVMLKIKEYARKNYQPNEQLFIFFAGHGQFDDVFKEGYVVARDSKFDEESKSSYISHSNLKTYINSIPCEHIFLVMDVCFGGTFDPVLAMRGADSKFDKDVEEMVRRKMRYKTRRFLTSGGKEYVPDGAPGRHSPFVRKFLEALRNEGGEDGILNISEIINQVQHANPQPHAGEFGTNEPGSDFLFIRR
ncbi:MAG: caspase family protein, partial [Bacteroidota bacterium]